ncbi:MAG TPA: BamA/TamA family outer membrane protein, partial [Burkholderiales bacterium]|nr:BamA/TamA family outer membrane protein [Burkholderiales bacterium]
TTSLDTGDLSNPLFDRISKELSIDTVGAGLIGQYDTRDNDFGPSRGVFAALKFYHFDKAIGSDFDYNTMDASWNQYFDIGRYGVVGGRVSGCAASDDTPFFDLCQFGQNNDLRGYVSGRYRDHAMYAAQVEYRSPFFHRFGAVVFTGIGQVGPDWGSFSSKLLHSTGAGVRFLASEKNRVTASVDYTRVGGENAWYFYIGDAF